MPRSWVGVVLALALGSGACDFAAALAPGIEEGKVIPDFQIAWENHSAENFAIVTEDRWSRGAILLGACERGAPLMTGLQAPFVIRFGPVEVLEDVESGPPPPVLFDSARLWPGATHHYLLRIDPTGEWTITPLTGVWPRLPMGRQFC